MTSPLHTKLLKLNLRYSVILRAPGWEHAYTDDLMRIVLEHHNIRYDKAGLHQTFIAWAPHLFVGEMS